MPRKKINTFLIVIVVIIWGCLLYKFVSPYFNDNNTNNTIAQINTNAKQSIVYVKDTFSLQKVNYDPFLAKNYTSYKPTIKTSKKSSKKKVKTKAKWPKIKYLGFVKSNKNKEKLALLRVDNNLHRVRPKEKVSDLYIINVYRDSIGLKLGDQTKHFKK